VPVIMYHSVVSKSSKCGKYAVSQKLLEQDLKYLKTKGYTTLTAHELWELLKEGGKVPHKAIILTFDDGYYNNLLNALPLLEKYDMKAVISVVGKYTEIYGESDDKNPAYAYLDYEDIDKLMESGRIEIANHSYDLHRQTPRHGTMQIKGENDEHYKKAFIEDTEKCKALIEEHCKTPMTTYTYPFGQITPASQGFLKDMGYTVIFTCYEKINTPISGESPIILGRFNRPFGISTADFMKKCKI
ncbi:MAG: polysaccharide deacetylase family protein, partial [Oscillospiraceae bacterium]